MSRYSIGVDARRELRDILRYVAERNPSAAAALQETFLDKFRVLASQPLLGDCRDDLSPGIRTFSAGSYLILYRPKPGGVVIVQVVHTARDVAALRLPPRSPRTGPTTPPP